MGCALYTEEYGINVGPTNIEGAYYSTNPTAQYGYNKYTMLNNMSQQ